MIQKRKKMVYSILTLVLIFSFGFLFTNEASALSLGIGKPFGGMVFAVIPCPCSANAIVIIGPPKGGRYMIDFGVKLYSNYSPTPGHWVLGLADAYTPCVTGVPPFCFPFGGGPRIRIIGTS